MYVLYVRYDTISYISSCLNVKRVYMKIWRLYLRLATELLGR